MSKKRLALIIPTLDRSGAEKQFTLLATGLPQAEFDVHVLALTRGGPYEAELRAAAVPVTILDKRWKFDPQTYWRLKEWLRNLQPDLIHTWLFAGNAYGRLAAKACPLAKVIVSERCVDSWKQGWQLWLDRRLISRTDKLVGNSQSVVEFYRQLGVPNGKLACVPNGIEIPSTIEFDRGAMLRELGWPEDAFVAGYVGRMADQKRVDDLIFAVETLRQTRLNLRLLLVGNGPKLERLQQFARDVGCAEHVRFLGHRDDAARWLALMDVFCLASSFEGMSNSLMEAMAAGKPVVVSDIPPNRELVTQGETGFLATVGDRVAYMQFLRLLIDDAALREKLGNAARTRMEREFSIKTMIANYIRVYEDLTSKPADGVGGSI